MGRQVLQFLIHLAAVYLTVWYVTPWVAGRFFDWILPPVNGGPSGSHMEFMFSHIFSFTFVPGLIVGLINSKHRHRVALFVWIVPVSVLLFDLCVFPTTAFQNHWAVALHYYFGGGFVVPEFYSYRDLFSRWTPDMARGIAQLHITGPVYAAVGYSTATVLSKGITRHAQTDRTLTTAL